MKKILSSVLIIAVWMILPMTLWANEVTQYEVSDTDTEVSYAGLIECTSDVAPSNPDLEGRSWTDASFFKDSRWFEPSTTAPFDAIVPEWRPQWISIDDDGNGLDADQTNGERGVYLYRKTFRVPAVAYNMSAEAAIASDNYGWLSVNGVEVLQPKDLTPTGINYTAPPSTESIPVKLLACNNVLVAEVQNGFEGCTPPPNLPNQTIGEPNGPTGVIFSLTLDYELPHVVWQPPVSNLGPSGRKNGSTLPLKFRFYTQDGKLIKQPQQVYLAVHEGGYADELGDIVAEWNLGNSVRNMRFSKGNGQYIANFQTQKEVDLHDGWYTAVVHDGCTGEALGHMDFELVGKKKEKDPKPPKPKK